MATPNHDADALVQEKTPMGASTSLDNSLNDSRRSKESLSKAQEAGVHELPIYTANDAEAIGEGHIGALETAEDIVTTVIHVDDDPNINPWTFRMFFIGQLVRRS
jgi:hypothetical protein